MTEDRLVVHAPSLPCGKVPIYCTSTERHAAHDHGPTEGPHAGELTWHCYGLYGKGETPSDDVVEACGQHVRG